MQQQHESPSSWSTDQTKPSQADQRSSAPTQRAEHPARSIMTRRWEERLARKNTPADPTVSGIQTLPTTSDAARADDKPKPPPIPPAALTIRSPLPLLHSPLAHAPAADGGELPPHWTSNPQRALLIVAAGACVALLVLLYWGGFLG